MSISAVMVNHNTSAWAELAVRSLFVQHPQLDVRLTVYDNGSDDEQGGLRAAAAQYGVPIVPSGHTLDSPGNSHGEVLSAFVLDPAQRAADHLLFLDADVCFTRPGTVDALLRALEGRDDLFGVGPWMSWDGETPLPAHLAANPALYRDRLHPCCALIRHSSAFRSVVEQVGLSAARLLHADHDEFLDTFGLMTRVISTHGLGHAVVEDTLIMHAFAVSYPDESGALLPEKEHRRDRWLERMRAAVR